MSNKVEALAREFSKRLLAEIGEEKLKEVVRLNNAKTNVCHTHDYTDANEVMVEAWKSAQGKRFPACPTEGDLQLFNSAWSMAKANDFYTVEKSKAGHTPGPWRVQADPDWAGKHPYHDNRFITSGPADILPGGNWEQFRWEHSSIIATMRDGERQAKDAALIAAAPELLAACEAIMKAEDMQSGARGVATMGSISLAIDAARAAIAKAQGGAK